MVLIAINFTKLSANRDKPAKGEVTINSNLSLTDVNVSTIKGNTQQATLTYKFKFTTNFDPKVGQIELEGDSIYLEPAKKAKEISENWKKTKKIPKEELAGVMNSILQKSHVEAILISRSVGLPPPIQLPKVRVKN